MSYLQNIFRKKVKGYFSVEASLIVPIVILLIAFLLWLSFFLYNRCIASEDSYTLAFRGSLLCGKNEEEIKHYLEENAKLQINGKYFGLHEVQKEINITKDKITVSIMAGMKLTNWTIYDKKQADRNCPAEYIRNIRIVKSLANKSMKE